MNVQQLRVIPDSVPQLCRQIVAGWCDLIQQFGRLFKRAVGSPQVRPKGADYYAKALPGYKSFLSKTGGGQYRSV